MAQSEIDAAVQKYYAELFDEGARLSTRSAQGRLEFERTQKVVRVATPAPARVLDVGGATGTHAAALAAAGYDVVLVDPVKSQVDVAARYGTFTALVGDARSLDFADDSFDAVLMAGPLYHLASREDRVQALREGRRVCRPDGIVHAAAIPRFAGFAAGALHRGVLESHPQAWLDLLMHGSPVPSSRFPGGHFHTAEELRDELITAGLRDVRVVGLEGPVGVAFEQVQQVPEAAHEAAMQLAETLESVPATFALSNHLLGSGTK